MKKLFNLAFLLLLISCSEPARKYGVVNFIVNQQTLSYNDFIKLSSQLGKISGEFPKNGDVEVVIGQTKYTSVGSTVTENDIGFNLLNSQYNLTHAPAINNVIENWERDAVQSAISCDFVQAKAPDKALRKYIDRINGSSGQILVYCPDCARDSLFGAQVLRTTAELNKNIIDILTNVKDSLVNVLYNPYAIEDELFIDWGDISESYFVNDYVELQIPRSDRFEWSCDNCELQFGDEDVVKIIFTDEGTAIAEACLGQNCISQSFEVEERMQQRQKDKAQQKIEPSKTTTQTAIVEVWDTSIDYANYSNIVRWREIPNAKSINIHIEKSNPNDQTCQGFTLNKTIANGEATEFIIKGVGGENSNCNHTITISALDYNNREIKLKNNTIKNIRIQCH